MNPVRRESLPVLVAKEIHKEIDAGRLEPGDRLPSEQHLRDQLGVSRAAVREALRILEGQGIIEFRFSGGTFIRARRDDVLYRRRFYKREELLELLDYEIVQLESEGIEVSDHLRDFVHRGANSVSQGEIEQAYAEARESPVRHDYAYVEPSSYESIADASSADSAISYEVDAELLQDRLLAAWRGRVIGCMFGKPTEGWQSGQVESYLKRLGIAQLDDYVPYYPQLVDGQDYNLATDSHLTTRGNVRYAAPDDDLDYTILNVHILQNYGSGMETDDVAEEWLNRLAYNSVFTAERQAYANLVDGVEARHAADVANPYREWIGAQIRADAFGYVCAGSPSEAARLAYQDAALSHRKNGIYGAMFVAACLASALAARGLQNSIEDALGVIPTKSRSYHLVQSLIDAWQEGISAADAFARVQSENGHLHFVHQLHNLGIVVIALLWFGPNYLGAMDFVVRCGLDSDCNGATVGSVVGAAHGTDVIPERLVSQLNDRVRTRLSGVGQVSITQFARDVYALWKSISHARPEPNNAMED
jgi:DNA-binding transcriptional regulator YhcF (GntR family)/ADP-ribosylglycohydrolase